MNPREWLAQRVAETEAELEAEYEELDEETQARMAQGKVILEGDENLYNASGDLQH